MISINIKRFLQNSTVLTVSVNNIDILYTFYMHSGENCQICAKMLCENKSKHFDISGGTNSIRIQCNPKFILKEKGKI